MVVEGRRRFEQLREKKRGGRGERCVYSREASKERGQKRRRA
jgi:hypothetical protein